MIKAGDFRNGAIIDIEGKIYQIVEVKNVKPETAAAFVRTKLRDIITSDVIEKTFHPDDELAKAPVERKDMQFLFRDDNAYHFMDIDSYDEIEVLSEVIGDSLKFVKENVMVKVCSCDSVIFAVEAPLFVELLVTDTKALEQEGADTNELKPVTVETGAVVTVPAFVEVGDVIKIDTRTGEYLSRV